jgi:hypothetical protein
VIIFSVTSLRFIEFSCALSEWLKNRNYTSTQSNNYAKQQTEIEKKKPKQAKIKKGKPRGLPIKPTHEAVEEEEVYTKN